ncbi:MAG: hypothetical protein SFY81_01410 [Verrucomicrobiota bacterium]|nr:hypothetical protein [Verrucomicrobiota bacterium]
MEPITLSTVDSLPTPVAVRKPRFQRLRRFTVAAFKYLWAVLFTQGMLAFLIVGWTYRKMQYSIARRWWKLSGSSEPLADALGATMHSRHLKRLPNWFAAHDYREYVPLPEANLLSNAIRRFKTVFHNLTGSFWLNAKVGFKGLFTTSVLVLPAGVIWLFSWYDGWHNSFNKGYEQAVVGPALGVFGIILFITAMLYVPMAQARQASTGNWKSFFQFRIVWMIVRRKWLAMLLLAMLYSALAVPLMFMKSAVAFFPNINPELSNYTDAQALSLLKTYFFYCSIYFVAAYFILRLVAARIYANGLVECVQGGLLLEDQLAEREWELLHRFDLLKIRPAPTRHVLVRTVAWLGTRVGRAITAVALVLVWFSFVAQIYVSEFIIKKEFGLGWLNQPLVQLPYFRYIPSHLSDGKELDR